MMCLVHLVVVLLRRFALFLRLIVSGRRPGLRPGGRLTFFVSPKKVSKERRPDVHALLRRVRCAAQLGRGLAKLAALKQTRALYPPKSALLAVPDGRWGAGTNGCCCAATPLCFTRRARLLRSAVRRQRSARQITQMPTNAAGCTTATDFVSALASSPAPDFPVGQGRAAECQGDQAPRLSERSEFSGDPPGASSAGNHEVALTSGRLSFGYFALAKQRKVPRPPGRTPGLHPQPKSRTTRAKRQSQPPASPPDPDPACFPPGFMPSVSQAGTCLSCSKKPPRKPFFGPCFRLPRRHSSET